MKSVIKFCLVLMLLSRSVEGSAPPPFDLQKFIEGQLAAGKTTITIPPGKYRVLPHKKTHLYLRNLSNITIEAAGVEMICTETTRAVWVRDCTNLTIRGLTIDYDPLPFTQGRITAISDDRNTHEVELFDGYPAAKTARGYKYEIFRPDTRTLRYGEYHLVKVEVLAPRKIRVIKDESQRQKAGGEEVGDLIVIASEDAPGGSEPHAVVTEDSKDIRYEKVTVYASNCFGFLEISCDKSVYQSCSIERRTPESDPVLREQPRLRSLNADAYHSKFAVRGPQLLGCSAHFQGDDAVNINGSYHLIVGSERNVLQVLANDDMNILPGDEVEMVDRSGKMLPEATVRTVRADGTVSLSEKQLLETLPILLQVRTKLKKRYLIEIDSRLQVAPGSVICSRQRVGNGFKVNDCRFGFNRSRGILIKAGDGEVNGNILESCGMQSILVAPEYYWLEAGFSRNLQICDNTITNSGKEAVAIKGIGNFPGHKNITISGNRIQTDYSPAVVISGAEKVRVTENTLNGRVLGRQSSGVDVKFSEDVSFGKSLSN